MNTTRSDSCAPDSSDPDSSVPDSAAFDPGALDWQKGDGLLPAVIQDAGSGAVLMLGYMNREALAATLASRRVTFWSRSKQRLWIKGETSGHFLDLVAIAADCDQDALLILAQPAGPACHTGTATCWGADAPRADAAEVAFLNTLERIIDDRLTRQPDGSYTAKLVAEGTRRVAQKVGEEGLELALAGVVQADEEVIGEAADLLYHTLLLLKVRDLSLTRVIAELKARHEAAGTLARDGTRSA
jgi:phosphoribosyl-ATP pyrophosphohydrolase/phosphoribosyl-AMP cyclohydrolase